MKIFTLLLITVSFITPFTVRATNIKHSEIPEPVLKGFKEDHPNAKDIKVSKQIHFGLTLYEVQFILHGHSHEALFDPTGEPFGHEEELKRLPKLVKFSLKHHLGKYKMVNAVSLQHPDGRIEYEIDVVMNNQLWEVVTNENGKILVKERLE